MRKENPRYPYPFRDFVTPQSRHHIVPFQKLVSIGKEILAHENEAERTKYVNDIIDAYFSSHPDVSINFESKEELKRAIHDKRSHRHSEAERDFLMLLAWLPGNIVIGRSGRTDDPGDILDRKAMGLSSLNARRGSFFALDNHVTKKVEYYIVAFIIELAKGRVTKTNDDMWN